MALAGRKPSAPNNTPQQTIKPTTFESVVTDNKKKAVRSLLAYIEGSKWTTDTYYSQQLLKHDDPKPLDTGQQDTYQSYRAIKGLELRVTSPFSVNQDTETNALSAEGTALLYPVLVPNVGDMFTAVVGTGYDGIFRITEVTVKHFNLDAVHEIQFSLFGIRDKNPTYFTDIESKVVRRFVFRKDRLVIGLNPLITTEEDSALLDLNSQFNRLVNDYFTLFYKQAYGCLLLPDNTKRVYDPYIPLFIRSLLTTDDIITMRDMRVYTLDSNPYANQRTVFDALLQRNVSLLSRVVRSTYLVSKQNFLRNGFLEGFRYQPVDYTVFPADIIANPILDETSHLRFLDSAVTVEITSKPTPPIIKLMEQLSKETYKPLVPKLKPGSYLFNESFYVDNTSESILEQLLLDYLNNKAIDVSALGKLIETVSFWDYLEQFYYVPFILLLIKAVSLQV